MTAPVTATLSAGQISAGSQSNFLVSFLFLSAHRRAGLAAIYAFCRVADDAVDEAPDAAAAEQGVAFWRQELAAAGAGTPTTGVGRALQQTMREFGLTPEPLRELLDGVAMDIRPQGFADLPALEGYCRKVASAVGLACLPVFGVAGAAVERYADRLGLALQLTNVLRDLQADAQLGRTYVPRQWLAECGVDPAWLSGAGPAEVYGPDGPVAGVMRRLHGAASARFAEARAVLGGLPRGQRRRLLPARIMGAVYGEILRRLGRRPGDLAGPRVRLSKAAKLWLAVRTALGLG